VRAVAVRAQVDAGRSLEAIFGPLDAMKFRSSVDFLGLATGWLDTN
jgi:uncharacterized protein (DUF1810 family)